MAGEDSRCIHAHFVEHLSVREQHGCANAAKRPLDLSSYLCTSPPGLTIQSASLSQILKFSGKIFNEVWQKEHAILSIDTEYTVAVVDCQI